MGLSQFDETVSANVVGRINAGDGTGDVDIGGPTNSTWRIDDILLTNTDTIDHEVALSINCRGEAMELGIIKVLQATGVEGERPTDILHNVLSIAGDGLVIDANTRIRLRVLVAMVGTAELQFMCLGGAV